MTPTQLDLDPLESQIIARAADSAVTRRRIWYCVFIPLAFIGLLLVLFWREAQPPILLWLFVGYVALNMLEKIGYGLAVLGYKRVIRKLLTQVEQLQAHPPAAADSPDATQVPPTSR